MYQEIVFNMDEMCIEANETIFNEMPRKWQLPRVSEILADADESIYVYDDPIADYLADASNEIYTYFLYEADAPLSRSDVFMTDNLSARDIQRFKKDCYAVFAFTLEDGQVDCRRVRIQEFLEDITIYVAAIRCNDKSPISTHVTAYVEILSEEDTIHNLVDIYRLSHEDGGGDYVDILDI